MTEIDLDELEQLAKAATPKWYSTGGIFDPGTDHETVNMWGETLSGMQSGYCFGRCPRHDGQFIAAASPRTILALIARIRKLEAVAEAAPAFIDAVLDAMVDVERYIADVDYAAICVTKDRLQSALAALDAKEET